jgi:RNA polymerase sigma-70 factor (ECF subfamily)
MEAQWQTDWEQRLFAWACAQVRREVSDTSWQAFWRTAVEGRAGKEVAADLGLTIAAVYHARSRILARLKELASAAAEP